MTANYDGLEFKTRLEAQWAAFFDLAGWSYWTNPVTVGDWRPDFKLRFDCSHSECGGYHVIFSSVLPVSHLNDVKGHPSLKHIYGVDSPSGERLADAGAIFGKDPSVTTWEMSHGAGGGTENLAKWVPNSAQLWAKASDLVDGC
ncbi:hypothetical protein [Polaromonas sp. YR568]|uniref:hypothetical protein n=1 Tax=Polaromonas sp. YR568 TaxID=1855301 RepID=UPI00398BEFF2